MQYLRFLLLWVAIASGFSAAGATITREMELQPVRLTYEELAALLTDMTTLVEEANKGYESHSSAIISITIAKGEYTHNLDAIAALSETNRLPEQAEDARFNYLWYGAPIEKLSLHLGDRVRSRIFEIEGSSIARIDSLSALISSRINQNSTIIGGTVFRYIGAVIISVVAILLFLFNYGGNKVKRAMSMLAAALLYSSVFMLPWSSWFPGTAIVASYSGFIDRYANTFTFIAFCIATLSFLSPVLAKMINPETQNTKGDL